jgi:hypothetical protein
MVLTTSSGVVIPALVISATPLKRAACSDVSSVARDDLFSFVSLSRRASSVVVSVAFQDLQKRLLVNLPTYLSAWYCMAYCKGRLPTAHLAAFHTVVIGAKGRYGIVEGD